MDEFEVMIELLTEKILNNLEELPPELLNPPQTSHEIIQN
jgi:hypothetical protein